jgi:preprotein translocase subunit SecE
MRDSTATKPASTRGKFIGEVVAEIKKVTWLSRREILNLTIMVLIVAIVVALILGGVDYGFSYLIQFFING